MKELSWRLWWLRIGDFGGLESCIAVVTLVREGNLYMGEAL